ncbi:PH domain-containing protein [Aeromicrobium massiliense]|uniref:PH domain-containing protein n=1 Tax=Aeromicrobium massiliense TaxID=1464554 RepID=UPI0005786CCC|nr:PH domain-containing protein [Aeromicrobium massiliense]
MTDLFAAPQDAWQRVSPALATRDRVVAAAFWLPFAVAGVVVAVLPLPVWARVLGGAVAVVALVGLAVDWSLAERRRARRGYLETDDEVLLTEGVMFRSMTVVPYGRLQYVDVEAGPLQRRLGIATLTVHTASPRTAAELPGLPADEAARLRGVLTERVRERGAGV